MLALKHGDLVGALHATMAADTVAFLLSPFANGPDERGLTVLKALLADGCPNVIFLIQGMTAVPPNKQKPVKNQMQKIAEL